MKTLNLSDSEFETIRVALSEFWDNESEWLDSCISNQDLDELKKAAVNVKNTENLLKNSFKN